MRVTEMKRKGLILGCTLAVLLTGCGASAGSMKNAVTSTVTTEAAMDDAYFYDYSEMESEEAVLEAPEENDTGSADIEVQDTNRKLIRNVDMDVETEEFDALLVNVQNRISSLSGYLESSDVYNGSYSASYRDLRSAHLTARIPAEHLDEFLSLVSETANVVRKDETVTDVTLQYVDMQSHKTVLLTEQERLMELLEQAESIEDIITLESRLSEVRYQIESMESQLRTFDNQVSYSTVYLYIEEVKTYTPVKEQTRLEKMASGFKESLAGVGNGFLDFCVSLVIALPYLIVWVVVIVLLVLLIRLIVKKTAKHRMKRMVKAREEAVKRQMAYEAHVKSMESTTDAKMSENSVNGEVQNLSNKN